MNKAISNIEMRIKLFSSILFRTAYLDKVSFSIHTFLHWISLDAVALLKIFK